MAKRRNEGPAGIFPQPKISTSLNKGVTYSVRVRDIVLSPNHPRFEEVGGWQGLGTIFYSSIETPGLKSSFKTNKRAKPYFSNSKFYPLINEIVAVIKGPDFLSGEFDSRIEATAYYFPPMAGWNHPHHNASPDPIQKGVSEIDYYKSYNKVEAGGVNRQHTQTNKIYLGNKFEESSNIRGLYPYEGDHILEGRFGNSIRFGSTTTSNYLQNNWSGVGNQGDPILILRNGTFNSKISNVPGYLPTVENINDDLSSIYLTSTQQIPIFTADYKTDSFGPNDISPSPPSEYEGNQILITSGRVILNAKADGILLSSSNIIHLSSGNSIHLDSTDKVVLSTGQVYLGDRNASERAILGDKLVLHLRKFLTVIEGLGGALISSEDAAINTYGTTIEEEAKRFIKELENDNFLSKKVKLK